MITIKEDEEEIKIVDKEEKDLKSNRYQYKMPTF